MKPIDLGDVAGFVAAVAALGTFVVYFVIARYAKGQLDQAERLRSEQARPYVIAEFIPGFLIDFRIRNLGATMARDVRMAWDEWPESSLKDSPWSAPADFGIFRDGIPMLAPSQEIKTLFDSFTARIEQDLPMSYRLTVNYRDTAGHAYQDQFVLDLSIYLTLEEDERKTIHDVAKELKNIADLLGRWSAPGHAGIQITALDGRTEEKRAIRTRSRRRYRAIRNKSGISAACSAWLHTNFGGSWWWPRSK